MIQYQNDPNNSEIIDFWGPGAFKFSYSRRLGRDIRIVMQGSGKERGFQ